MQPSLPASVTDQHQDSHRSPSSNEGLLDFASQTGRQDNQVQRDKGSRFPFLAFLFTRPLSPYHCDKSVEKGKGGEERCPRLLPSIDQAARQRRLCESAGEKRRKAAAAAVRGAKQGLSFTTYLNRGLGIGWHSSPLNLYTRQEFRASEDAVRYCIDDTPQSASTSWQS